RRWPRARARPFLRGSSPRGRLWRGNRPWSRRRHRLPARGSSYVQKEAGPHRVVGIEHDLAEAGQVRSPGDLGQDGRPPALCHRLAADPGCEAQPEQALADERGADAHEAPMVEEGQACARARPARGGIDLARAPDERVGRDAVGVWELVNEHVVHARLAEARYLDLELSVD